MTTNFLAGQASLWVQPDGPNSEPKYLGCHSVGDIPEPKGDSTLLWCPDPAQVGKFIVKNSFKGEPGAITTSIETDLRKTADYLEDLADLGCPFPLYVHKVSCGRRDVFSNFDRSFVLLDAEITNATLANLASRNPADEGESTQSFDLSVRQILRVFNLEVNRFAITETEDITALAFAGENRCEGACGASQKEEDYLLAVSKALVGSVSNTADVLLSEDGGSWLPTTADPFDGGEDIQGVVSFRLSRDDVRIIVARGTTDAGNHAEIAFSDDYGVTWTNVDVGSVDGEFVSNAHALFALDRYHIWLGSNLGRIYFSSDAGLTWTIQENAVISATPITGISFSDDITGFAIYTGGETAKCSDGESWSATGSSGATAACDIHTISAYSVWTCGSNGLYFSTDLGLTWTQRLTYNVKAIDFLNPLFGVIVGGGTNANVWMTIDGGFDWVTLTAIANTGFTDVKCVSTKSIYVCGNISNGTGFIGKLIPVD